MKTWKTIIIDDEPLARLELRKLLGAFHQISVVGEADSVTSAKRKIESLLPDLIFLDIDLGTRTGFDLLESVDHSFKTIFVTAYDKYAIRAFEVNALDYLLKPVHPERLKESIARLENPVKEDTGIKLHPSDKILINCYNQSRFVSVDTICCIEAKGDYTRICTDQDIKGMVHQTVTKWITLLPVNLFLRVHRSYIVNIDHIQRLEKRHTGSFRAVLVNNMQVPVSRNYLKDIKSKFSVD